MPQKNLPMLNVRADVAPSTINIEKRTVEVVWTTGAKGLRYDWYNDTRYYEELEVTDSAIRLDRMRNGAPLLDCHDQWSNRSVIGVVESVRIENGKGIAVVRFAENDEVADAIWNKVRQGILRNISVGYKVHKYERIAADPNAEDRTPTYRAIDWEPSEVSFVPIGFDAEAVVRSAEQNVFPVEIIERSGSTALNVTKEVPVMDEEEIKARAAEEAKRAAEQAAKLAVETERKRSAEIRQAVRAARMEDSLAMDLIERGVTVDQARAEIIDKLAAVDESKETRSQNGVDFQFGGNQSRTRSAMASALLARLGVQDKNEDAQQFRFMTLQDMCRSALQASGVNTYAMAPMDMVKRAMTTSDLPNVFLDAMNKRLLNAYREQPQTFRQLGRKTTANDFKSINAIRMSAAPELLKKNENGEFQHGTWSDQKETYALATYGRFTKLTREMLINDDLNALDRWMTAFGASAARLESKLIYTDMLLANPTMSDGVALFHATHGNLGTAGAISTATVGGLRTLLRKQKGLAGEELDIQPKYILAGPDQETALNQFLSGEIYSATQDGVAPAALRNSIVPIIENRVTGNQFFVFADYNQIDTFEYCYLNGSEGVYTESEVEFLSGDLKIGARHDFASKFIDWRGVARNNGQ
jgi:hypothetical protein